jgi:hypothetical protein
MHRAPVLAVALALFAGFVATHAASARADDANEKGMCSAKYQSAQRWRAAGKLTLARADLLRCAEPACPTFVSNDCKTWLAELDDELPTLVYAVLDSNGGDLPNAVLRVDGADVAHATDGLGHPIDPGEHVVDVSAGGQSLRQQIVVRVGEKSRRIELRLAVAPDESASVSTSTTRIPTATYVLGGVGVAAIATGSVLWIVGSNAAKTYNDDCATIGCTESQREHAHTLLTAGDVAWGVGLAAGIGAVAVFLLNRELPAAPTVSFGPASVSLSGRF